MGLPEVKAERPQGAIPPCLFWHSERLQLLETPPAHMIREFQDMEGFDE